MSTGLNEMIISIMIIVKNYKFMYENKYLTSLRSELAFAAVFAMILPLEWTGIPNCLAPTAAAASCPKNMVLQFQLNVWKSWLVRALQLAFHLTRLSNISLIRITPVYRTDGAIELSKWNAHYCVGRKSLTLQNKFSLKWVRNIFFLRRLRQTF